MNSTLCFVRLDYLTIKPYLTLKNIVVFLIVVVFICYGTGEPSTLIGMLMMYSTIYASYPFAVGDKNGIDTLYSTLPLKKKTVVAGRYVFAISLNILTGLASLAGSAIIIITSGKEFDFKTTLITVLICFILFSVLEAVQLPIYFKLGYVKAKFLAYLSLAAFPAAVTVITTFVGKNKFLPILNSIFFWMQSNIFPTIILVIIVWFLSLLISLLLSCHFYKSREF